MNPEIKKLPEAHEILTDLLGVMRNSFPLKDHAPTDEMTINEFIYAFELLSLKYKEAGKDITVTINYQGDSGVVCIPCTVDAQPLFVSNKTRALKKKIKEVEIYDEDDYPVCILFILE